MGWLNLFTMKSKEDFFKFLDEYSGIVSSQYRGDKVLITKEMFLNIFNKIIKPNKDFLGEYLESKPVEYFTRFLSNVGNIVIDNNSNTIFFKFMWESIKDTDVRKKMLLCIIGHNRERLSLDYSRHGSSYNFDDSLINWISNSFLEVLKDSYKNSFEDFVTDVKSTYRLNYIYEVFFKTFASDKRTRKILEYYLFKVSEVGTPNKILIRFLVTQPLIFNSKAISKYLVNSYNRSSKNLSLSTKNLVKNYFLLREKTLIYYAFLKDSISTKPTRFSKEAEAIILLDKGLSDCYVNYLKLLKSHEGK